MKLKLQVVTPTRTIVSTDAESVELPGELGYLGILPGHTPLITVLKTGVLTYRNGAEEHSLAISAGFAEISGDAVEREITRAEEELKSAGVDTVDEIRTRLELAQAQLAIAKRGK
jgi:F-type H+-transporting ATPase subunit epsilon